MDRLIFVRHPLYPAEKEFGLRVDESGLGLALDFMREEILLHRQRWGLYPISIVTVLHIETGEHDEFDLFDPRTIGRIVRGPWRLAEVVRSYVDGQVELTSSLPND